jgi:hypothetical protein
MLKSRKAFKSFRNQSWDDYIHDMADTDMTTVLLPYKKQNNTFFLLMNLEFTWFRVYQVFSPQEWDSSRDMVAGRMAPSSRGHFLPLALS